MGALYQFKQTLKRDFQIASWNINSIRLRQDLVVRFLRSHRVDFLCLQEIKCEEDEFPNDRFTKLGYKHQIIFGQKAYHGVAILSRHAFKHSKQLSFGERKKDLAQARVQARHVSICFESASGLIELHNFYVPAGGDEPDVKTNEKFSHKLRFVRDMEKFFKRKKNRKSILVGDLNIAPNEHDVWSHKQLLNVVSHTPVEVRALNKLMQAGAWVDIARLFVPLEKKLYSWWSYRARDWFFSDRGRRLDHIWTSADLAEQTKDFFIAKKFRGATKPSDHAPVVMTIRL